MKAKINILTVIALMLLISTNSFCQDDEEEYRNQYGVKKFNWEIKDKSAKKVVVEYLDGELLVESYNGNEIKVEANRFKAPPARAKGLKSLSSTGVDNTGLGLSFTEKDGKIRIAGASPQSRDAEYHIKIPENMAILIDYSGFNSDDVTVKGITQEIEVRSKISDIKMENITGPAVVNNLSGDIEIVFTNINQQSPIAISNISGEVDITIPEKTPADLKLKTITGDVYTDLDIKIESTEKMRRIGGQNIDAEINGGGVEISISNTSGNIYLRKKE